MICQEDKTRVAGPAGGKSRRSSKRGVSGRARSAADEDAHVPPSLDVLVAHCSGNWLRGPLGHNGSMRGRGAATARQGWIGMAVSTHSSQGVFHIRSSDTSGTGGCSHSSSHVAQLLPIAMPSCALLQSSAKPPSPHRPAAKRSRT
jgi:hypothetical protein